MKHLTPPAESQWTIVARQFRRKRSAVWGLRVTLGLVAIAIYAPAIASNQPFVWRAQGGKLELPWFIALFDTNIWEHGLDRAYNLLLVVVTLWAIARLLLGSLVRMLRRRAAAALALFAGIEGSETWERRAARWLTRGTIALTLVLGFVQLTGLGLTTSRPSVDYRAEKRALAEAGEPPLAVFPVIPYSYRDQLRGADQKFRGVLDFDHGERHLLGTDILGRDIFARILYGTRISLTIGIVAVSIYVTIGTILGALAGYFGKRVDLAIMRVVEVMICIPQLFLLLTIVALFQKQSIFLIMFAIGLVSWTSVTRLVRGEFLRERSIDYVIAARSMGFGALRIVFRHILPNAVGPVLVAATFGVAAAILIESGLSFLGLGDVTVPSWGAILNHGRENEYWHLILPPSVAIFITVTALNLVGDGLRDALDPKLRD